MAELPLIADWNPWDRPANTDWARLYWEVRRSYHDELAAQPGTEFSDNGLALRLLHRAAEIARTADDDKQKRLAARASLSGLLLLVAHHTNLREAGLLRPAESLFTELGDLDDGCVADALRPEKKPPKASSQKRRFQLCCIRADQLLRRSGMNQAERSEFIAQRLRRAAEREKVEVGKSTLKNWQALHKRAADSALTDTQFWVRMTTYDPRMNDSVTPGRIGASRRGELDERLKKMFRDVATEILDAVENGEYPEWIC